MKILEKVLINGTICAVESIPVIGSLLITPTKLSLQLVSSIAQASLALLTACAELITFGCFLLTIGIRILSSTTSCIYHLFATSKKTI